MTITERLNKAQAFLEASDEIAARELVDSVLREEPHNKEALRLDDAIVRQNVAEAHARNTADSIDLGFILPERSRTILIGLALLVLGVMTLFYVGQQVRTSESRSPALSTAG